MRYYFDIFDGDHWTRDDFGIELETDWKARHQAVLVLCEMAGELLPNDGAEMDLTVRVRTGSDVAFTVRLDFSTETGPALTDPAVGGHSTGA